MSEQLTPHLLARHRLWPGLLALPLSLVSPRLLAATSAAAGQDYWQWLLFAIALLVMLVYWSRKLSSEEKTSACANHLARSYLGIINQYVITSRTDLNGIINDVSEAFCSISGYSRDELIGHSHGIIRHPKTDESIYQELWQTLAAGENWQGEMCNRRKDGTTYWVKASITPDYDLQGNKIGYIAVHEDITDHKIVRELSLRDPLTGLYNRRYFSERFSEQLQTAYQNSSSLSLIILDIDNFKKYNDTYGHQSGDTALKQVAACLDEHCNQQNQRQSVVQAEAFRLGGEEFAILALLDNETCLQLAEQICHGIHQLQIEHINNEDFGVMTASLGCYSHPPQGITTVEADELFRIADQALYRAKELGRNQVQQTCDQATDIELF